MIGEGGGATGDFWAEGEQGGWGWPSVTGLNSVSVLD